MFDIGLKLEKKYGFSPLSCIFIFIFAVVK